MAGQRTGNAWLRRALLVPTLRRRMHVKVLSREFAKLCAVDCSPEEVGELKEVDSQLIADLVNALRFEIGATTRQPRVRVLCFGRSAKVELTPQPIRRFLENGSTCFWMPHLRTAITTFRDGEPILGQILHEATHGLLDELSDRFRYPYAVSEGYARLASDWASLRPDDAVDLSQHLNGRMFPIGRLDDAECISIEKLLQFRPFDYGPDDEQDRRRYLSELTRVSNASVWLVAYLALLGRCRPTVRRILRELRVKNIRSPGAVYEWLLHASGMTPEALERRFRLYCTKGLSP